MKSRVASLLCDIRNLDRLINSFPFEQALSSNPQDKDRIYTLIVQATSLNTQVRIQAMSDLTIWLEGKEETIRTLKYRAEQLGIRGYSRMSKNQLVVEIGKYGTRKPNEPVAVDAGIRVNGEAKDIACNLQRVCGDSGLIDGLGI